MRIANNTFAYICAFLQQQSMAADVLMAFSQSLMKQADE
jgi:hypothetical protein